MEEKIKKWLEEQGYPLEFKVANELRKNDFSVIQSDYYIDPETGENREMDIIAHKQTKINDTLFRLSIIIECKAGKDKPWLLFSSPDNELSDIARVAQTPSTELGGDFLSELAPIKKYQDMKIFSLGARTSFGITQCFTTGKDIPYQAIKGVAKATNATCKADDKRKRSKFCHIIFPIVVIEAPLYESYYEDELILNEIDFGTMAWRNDIVNKPHSIIKIQKIDAFKKLLLSYNDEFNTIIKDAENGLFRKAKKTFTERHRIKVNIY